MITYDDLETMARTIFGEARGESPEGQVAVACVILNRFASRKWFAGKTVAETCTKPMQFSCWNDAKMGGQRKQILAASTADLVPCFNAALTALHDGDTVQGATHYYADYIKPPAWAAGKQPVVVVGRHRFFSNID